MLRPLLLFLVIQSFAIELSAQCNTTIAVFPYNEGFEDGPMWTAGGTASDWTWGTPAHPLINTAGEGNYSWCVGGLDGSFYNYGQQSWLESPCFNFSDLEYPWISFKLFWELEQQYDGLGFQYSLDQGSTWSNVGSSGYTSNCMDQNWFNTGFVNALDLATPKQGWTGRVGATQGNCAGGQGSGQWVTASHCLMDLAGEQSVKFRFVFGAGTICNSYDGIAVDAIFIGEAPPNNAAFNFGCQGNTVEFQNSSALCPTAFVWDFGDPGSGAANTSTLADPVHTYPGPGTYQVSLTVTGPCNATSTVIIPVSIIEVELQGNDPLCSGTGGSITAQVIGATGPLEYDWTPSAPNSPVIVGLSAGNYSVVVQGIGICPVQQAFTLSNAVSDLIVTMDHTDISCAGMNDGNATFSVTGATGAISHSWSPVSAGNAGNLTGLGPGTYTVNVTDASGCSGSGSVVINEPSILTLASPDTVPICSGASAQLQAVPSGGTAPYAMIYSPDGPMVAPVESTTYTISVSDINGCIAPPAMTVVMVGAPVVPVFDIDDQEGCAPHCATFTSTAAGVLNWEFSDGASAGGSSVEHCFEAGVYDVTLTMTDDLGCVSTTFLAGGVQVYPSPVAAFVAHPPIATIGDPEIRFSQDSYGATSWWWEFGDASGETSQELSPVFSYSAVDCYTAALIVTNDFECSDEATATVCIEEEFAVYAPNTFTPNNDGVNDHFRIITSVGSPAFFNLLIFDRWGQQVYESNSPDQAWDGSFRSTELSSSIYIWVLRMKDSLGSMQERKGHITILR